MVLAVLGVRTACARGDSWLVSLVASGEPACFATQGLLASAKKWDLAALWRTPSLLARRCSGPRPVDSPPFVGLSSNDF